MKPQIFCGSTAKIGENVASSINILTKYQYFRTPKLMSVCKKMLLLINNNNIKCKRDSCRSKYTKIFLSVWKGKIRKPSKVAAGKKHSPQSVCCWYNFSNECFLLHVITGTQHFLIKTYCCSVLSLTSMLLLFWCKCFKNWQYYIRYLHNSVMSI